MSTQSHTGLYMAQILKDVLLKMGIEGKVSQGTQIVCEKLTTHQIIALTMDNALSCDALAMELATLLPGLFAGMSGRIHCFADIVNLASRWAMSVFNATVDEIKWVVAEIQAELEALGKDLTDVTIEVNVVKEDRLGSDLMGALKGMTEEEAAQIGEKAAPLRNTVQRVRTSYKILFFSR